jgi:hypothetical protein
MDARLGVSVVSGRQRAGRPVSDAMGKTALGCVGVVRPFTLHPFEISKARTVDKLVQHPRR